MTRSGFRPDTVRQRIGGEGCHQLFLLRSVLGNMKGKVLKNHGVGEPWQELISKPSFKCLRLSMDSL